MAGHVNGVLSPWLRRLRIRAVEPYIKGRVLDYGCNNGALANDISFVTYTGVDIEENSLRQARLIHPDLCFLHAADDLGEVVFDTITLLAVIEYIPNRLDLFSRLAKLLAPEGCMVITSPDPGIGLVRAIGGRIGLFANDERHLRQGLPSVESILYDLDLAGLQIVQCQRFMLGMNNLLVASHKSIG